MRPLGLNDTLFYNLRDAQITGVALLDGPPDLATLVAQAEGLLKALPGFAETPMRLGFWSFARTPTQPIDLTQHIFKAEAPDATSLADIARLLDRLRRNRLSVPGPQWRLIVLNPAGSKAVGGSTRPLSAVFVQLRHGLADAGRTVQALARMDGYTPTVDTAMTAARIASIDLGALPPHIKVGDVGPILLEVPREEIARSAEGPSLTLATAARAAVADAALFPKAQPLRGAVGQTKIVMRRGAAKGVGNHLKMETVRLAEPSGRTRWRILGLARAQELPISQWAVALAPSPLARLIMRVWYTSFDAIATLVPMPPRSNLGGRAVTAIFGVPPIWSRVPLLVLACFGARHCHMALYPARGFAGDAATLEAKLRGLLSPDTAQAAASRSR